MDVRTDRALARLQREARDAAQDDALAHRGDRLGHHVGDRLAATDLDSREVEVGRGLQAVDFGAPRERAQQLLGELLELRGLGNEVGLAVELDHHAFGRAHETGEDDALRGDLAGALGRGREALLTQVPDRALEVAAGRVQRRLAIHHAGAGLLAQLFHL